MAPAASTPPTSDATRRTRLFGAATIASLKLIPLKSIATRMSSASPEASTFFTSRERESSVSLTTNARTLQHYGPEGRIWRDAYHDQGDDDLTQWASDVGETAAGQWNDPGAVARGHE